MVVVNIYAPYLAVAFLIGWHFRLDINSTFSFEVVASGKHQPVNLFYDLSERTTTIIFTKNAEAYQVIYP